MSSNDELGAFIFGYLARAVYCSDNTIASGYITSDGGWFIRDNGRKVLSKLTGDEPDRFSHMKGSDALGLAKELAEKYVIVPRDEYEGLTSAPPRKIRNISDDHQAEIVRLIKISSIGDRVDLYVASQDEGNKIKRVLNSFVNQHDRSAHAAYVDKTPEGWKLSFKIFMKASRNKKGSHE